MVGDPRVEAPGKPAEPGSHEQRADGSPSGVTGAKHPGNGLMTARHLSILANPLHRCPALVRGEAELGEVQLLPGLNRRLGRGGATSDHPAHQKSGARRAEPALAVKDKDRQGGADAHGRPRVVTRAATRR